MVGWWIQYIVMILRDPRIREQRADQGRVHQSKFSFCIFCLYGVISFTSVEIDYQSLQTNELLSGLEELSLHKNRNKEFKYVFFLSHRWRVGPWQNCTRDCGGGVSWRVVTCIQTFEDGTQQLMRDSECDSTTRPSSRKSCNGYICPTWYAGDWSVVG